MDLFPTIMELTQTKSTQSVEGKSLAPILKKGNKPIHKFIAWEHQGNRAIREGDWKLVWDDELKKWELYNLKNDRIEANDLANSLPEKRKKLLTKYNQWALKVGVK
jgi:arylsulfatase